ncbi:MAG: hypothetical protein IJT32_07785 [Lachnospiraceae bacterium]|nr:hypothetical protein [Lachnospiraceae bacterium]
MAKSTVVIKSNANGLTLVLDPSVDFKTLIEDICGKFAESRDFFKNAELILALEGRNLSAQEAAVVIEAIELNSDIRVKLVISGDELKDARMIEMTDRFYFEDFFTNAKIIPGSVRQKSVVTSDSSIVILGDVNRGGQVEAAGNVLVMGEALGSITAGKNGDKRCYVAANFFDTEEITIAGISGPMKRKKGLFGGIGRVTTEPQAVFVWDDTLLMEPLSKGVVKQLLDA